MSSGKCAAQAAHAETLAMWGAKPSMEDPLFAQWMGYGHYAKYVMKAEDSIQMYTIERYLNERGFETYMVIDEGHTEGTYFVPTAMAVELVDKDDERVASIFGEFRRYRDLPAPKKSRRRFFRRTQR